MELPPPDAAVNAALRNAIFAAPLASQTGFRNQTPSLPPPLPIARHYDDCTLPDAKRAKPEPLPEPKPQRKPFAFDPHAGLLRVYGGVEQYLRMQAGEIPWPEKEEDW